MKILISGVSGAGKTTLAHHISKEYNIPFVVGSTKVFWKEYGIKNHQQLIKKTISDIDFGLEFQYKCLSYRMEEFSKHRNCVSDRGVIDNVLYFLLQVAPFTSSSVTADYIGLANQFLNDNPFCMNIFLGMPPKIHSDNMRITNKYYQETCDAMFDFIIKTYIRRNHMVHRVNKWEWNQRIKEVNNIISKNA